MKTKNVMLSILLVMGVSVMALANEPGNPKMAVVSQKSGIYKVIYEGENVGKVSMRIFNIYGQEVFADVVTSVKGFIRPVNFNGMEHGVYTIEVTNRNGKQIHKINYR